MKRLGQNFLTSKIIARRIADAASITAEDIVLEIGPGKGILTEAILASNPKTLIAVEKDKKLLEDLNHELRIKNYDTNSKFIHGDILDLMHDSSFIIHNSITKIVANIPYYITSRLLRLIFSQQSLPSKVALMMQEEVAERICAKPPHMNLLALSVQAYGKPKTAFRVPRHFFKPRPKVNSAVIVIDNISRDFFKASPFKGDAFFEKELFNLLHAGFRHKRKFLISNLKKSLFSAIPGMAERMAEAGWINEFRRCKISEKARAENLTLADWACLAKDIFRFKS